MQEGQRNTQNQCIGSTAKSSDYVFLLKRTNNVSLKFGIMFDFSSTPIDPALRSAPLFSNVPTFNRDYCFYTPAFILPQDKMKFEKNNEICLMSHQKKLKELQEEKKQIFVAKPSPSNSFCMICKETFDDYLNHTSLQSHKLKLKDSLFYQNIHQMCGKYGSRNTNPVGKKIKKQKKRKETKKNKIIKGSQKSLDNSSTGIQSPQYQENSLLNIQK